MVDARQLATTLVSVAILLMGAALVVGGGILIASGSGAVVGVLMALAGLAVLAGALFFNLVPLRADAYQPPRRSRWAESDEDDDGDR